MVVGPENGCGPGGGQRSERRPAHPACGGAGSTIHGARVPAPHSAGFRPRPARLPSERRAGESRVMGVVLCAVGVMRFHHAARGRVAGVTAARELRSGRTELHGRSVPGLGHAGRPPRAQGSGVLFSSQACWCGFPSTPTSGVSEAAAFVTAAGRRRGGDHYASDEVAACQRPDPVPSAAAARLLGECSGVGDRAPGGNDPALILCVGRKVVENQTFDVL